MIPKIGWNLDLPQDLYGQVTDTSHVEENKTAENGEVTLYNYWGNSLGCQCTNQKFIQIIRKKKPKSQTYQIRIQSVG